MVCNPHSAPPSVVKLVFTTPFDNGDSKLVMLKTVATPAISSIANKGSDDTGKRGWVPARLYPWSTRSGLHRLYPYIVTPEGDIKLAGGLYSVREFARINFANPDTGREGKNNVATSLTEFKNNAIHVFYHIYLICNRRDYKYNPASILFKHAASRHTQLVLSFFRVVY